MAKYEKHGNIYVGEQIRKDFMTTNKEGSSKGSLKNDPMESQFQKDREMSQKQIDNIYKNKRIAQNIIDIPAEDATREWIEFEDTAEEDELLSKLNDLNAQQAFQKVMEYERLTGDGFISLGASQNSVFNLDDPLDESALNDIKYLHPFSKKRVIDGVLDDDPFSEGYNRFVYYELEPLNKGTRLVHSSRVLHIQSRMFEGEKWGMPLMQGLKDPLTIMDSFAWSLGQIAYAMTFKVYKSPHVDFRNRDQAKSVAKEMESFFNTMSMAVIGDDESLTHESPGGSLPSIEAMTSFIWDYLSGAARMPKAHILGQQQGTITGGKYDSLNYYMRISGIQENYMRPLIERLVDLLYMAKDSGIGTGSVVDPTYIMKFKSLWKLDQKTDVEIRKLNAEIEKVKADTAKAYVDGMIYSPDEIRERFQDEKLMEKFDVDDMAEEARMAYEREVGGGSE